MSIMPATVNQVVAFLF